jgi:hypothetical protein
MEFKGYSSLWKAVVRPPRFEYDIADLGPQEFIIKNTRYHRTDVELKNIHGHTI